jgi:CDP-diacylglycerol--glycerol-3-phosphate 3-phosphatidyltransferase
MFILVALCGIADWADGWTARRYNIISQFGAFLDRMADKIFICPTMVILVWKYWPSVEVSSALKFLTEGLIIVIILLEITLMISGVFALFKILDTSSNKWGKAKMVFQSAAVFGWFLCLVIEQYLKIKIIYLVIFLIDAILIAAIGLAVKSIEEYWQRYQRPSQRPPQS